MSEYTQGLRRLADFLETNNLEPACDSHILFYLQNKAEMAKIARKYAPLKKLFEGDHFFLTKQFGPNVAISWFVNRDQVCRLIETRETITRARMVPDGEETVEVVKRDWVCDEPILAGAANGTD